MTLYTFPNIDVRNKTLLIISVNLFGIFWEELWLDSRKFSCCSFIVIMLPWCGENRRLTQFPSSMSYRLAGARRGTITHSCGRLSLRIMWRQQRCTEQLFFRVRSHPKLDTTGTAQQLHARLDRLKFLCIRNLEVATKPDGSLVSDSLYKLLHKYCVC